MTTQEKAKSISAKFNHLQKVGADAWGTQLTFQATLKELVNIESLPEDRINSIYQSWMEAPGG